VSPSGAYLFQRTGDGYTCRYEHSSYGVLLPLSIHNKVIGGSNIYNYDWKKISSINENRNRSGFSMYLAPSPDESFCIQYVKSNDQKIAPQLYLMTTSDFRAICPMKFDDYPNSIDIYSRGNDQTGLSIDKIIHPIPALERIAFVKAMEGEVVIHPFVLNDVLKNADFDYLFTSSVPPSSMKPGESLEYKIVVNSRQGKIKIKIEQGPDGMKLDKDAVLHWKMPSGQIETVIVVISISDSTGQEILHSFSIAPAK
jgi:hypothetical protein